MFPIWESFSYFWQSASSMQLSVFVFVSTYLLFAFSFVLDCLSSLSMDFYQCHPILQLAESLDKTHIVRVPAYAFSRLVSPSLLSFCSPFYEAFLNRHDTNFDHLILQSLQVWAFRTTVLFAFWLFTRRSKFLVRFSGAYTSGNICTWLISISNSLMWLFVNSSSCYFRSNPAVYSSAFTRSFSVYNGFSTNTQFY